MEHTTTEEGKKMSWTSDWIAAGRAAEKASEKIHECGTKMVVGYSNLGIPLATCPKCSPSIAANAKMPVGQAWGFNES